jgi:O-antigen/teichoic acid export membrane protein
VLRLILVVIALYWLKLGLTGIVAIPVIINLAVLFALVFVLRKEIFSGIEVRNLFVSWRELKGILSFGGQSHIGALIQKSNNEIAAPIMTAFIEPAAIGFYKLAWYLVGSVSRIEGVIDLVLMTKIARSKTEDLRKFFPQLHRFLFSLLMVLMLLSALIMPWFVRLVYGEAYTPVVPLFWILMPGVPLVTMITTTNTLFTQSGKPLMKSVIRIFGLLLNVALLLILMPKLHAVGAAIATSAGYILMFIISTSIVKSQLGVSTRDLLVLRRSDLSYLATNIKALYRRLPIHSLRAARLKQS